MKTCATDEDSFDQRSSKSHDGKLQGTTEPKRKIELYAEAAYCPQEWFSSSSEPISNLFLILKTAARTWPLDVEYIVYGALVYTVNSQLDTHAFAHVTLLF